MIPTGPTCPKCVNVHRLFYPAAALYTLSHTCAILPRLRGFLCVHPKGGCSDVHLALCTGAHMGPVLRGSPVGPVPRCLCIPAMSPGLPQVYLLSPSAQIFGLQGTRCLVVFSPALSPERSSGQHSRLQILRLLPAPGRIHPWAQLGQSPPPASSQACPFHRQYW